MKIAIVGAGSIGSTFALQLAQGGHEVTVVARGKRLEQLQREGAIVTSTGQRAPVLVNAALDATIAYDLVLVTVLAFQVDAVLPALKASAAKTVMFMFNTFEPLARLREAVGEARFTFGFPAILASLDEGVLTTTIVTRGSLKTTVIDPAWAKTFTAAGIPTVIEADMESWLRTHAAMVAPTMALSITAHARKGGVIWSEARSYARAIDEGFALVRELGNTITPPSMGMLARLPAPVVTSLLWTISRVGSIQRTGAAGPNEPRMLIDAMVAASKRPLPALLEIRP